MNGQTDVSIQMEFERLFTSITELISVIYM